MKRASSLTKQSTQTSKISTQTSFKPNPKFTNVKSKYKEPKKIPGSTSFDPTNSSGKLSVLPPSTFRLILQFCIGTYMDLMRIKSVSQRFFLELDQNIKNFKQVNPLGCQTIKEVMEQMRIIYFNSQITRYTTFHEKMHSMFQYGATKLNLPDKLLESLQLSVTATVNKKHFTPQLLFRKLNFASHLYFKIILDEIPLNMKKDTYDSISTYFKVESKYLELSKEFIKKYECQEILQKSISQKAFSYMTDGHYLFTYFDNDKQMLYMIWENSTIELMQYFWQSLKRKYFWANKALIQKQYKALMEQRAKVAELSKSRALSESKRTKQDEDSDDDEYIPFQLQKQEQLILPAIKQPPPRQQQQQLPPKPKQKKVSTFLKTKLVSEKIIYNSMKEYMYDQQDFELMINIHTGIKGQNLFYFVDTKAMPKLDDDCLYFTYKMKEHINLSYKLYLDNKLGMKEVVENLYLCDITFKDRDDFRILFSGFVQMFNEDTTAVAKKYDVSYLDIKEWRSLRLWDEDRFELVVLFGTQPSVIKLFELKLININ